MSENATLFTFAHRGEARATLKYFEMSRVADFPLELYSNAEKSFYLLITGEGSLEALAHTSSALAFLNGLICQVINLGIAGSLSSKITKDQILPIRTSYGQMSAREMHFKSYTLGASSFDAVTASERVLTPEQAHYLSSFAPIVDRELWAVARACSLFDRPLKAYKYISDEVWAQNEGQFCQQIKEKSVIYSEALLDYYLNTKEQLLTSKQDSDDFDFYYLPGLHFSVSMKKKMDSLLKSLQQKKQYFSFVDQAKELIKEKTQEKARPKDIAQQCLTLAHNHLMPFDHQVDLALKKLATPFSERGIEVHFDPQRESPAFWLKTHIQHPNQIEKLKQALAEFQFEGVEKVLQGQIDV